MTTYQPGDILAFQGTDWLSRLIAAFTFGPSHVGIVCAHEGKMVLVESTSLCNRPCMVRGELVSGVQVHDPDERIKDYEGGRVEVYRLMPVWSLTLGESKTLSETLLGFVGEHDGYDFLRAGLSATLVAKWLPYPDEGSQFCSELCAGALMRVGRFPISNPAAFNPASLCRTMRRTGVYRKEAA